MSDDLVKQALAELEEVVSCRCHDAYIGRGLQDPTCLCDSSEAVRIVCARIRELEAQVATLSPTPVTVSEAARVLLNNNQAIYNAFDASDQEIEKLAIDYAGNRLDAVGQLEIGETFFRAALRAIQENDHDSYV